MTTFVDAEAPVRAFLTERFGDTIGFESAWSMTQDARVVQLGVFTKVVRKISGQLITQTEGAAIPGLLMTMLESDLLELRDELRRVADLIDMEMKR